MPEASVGNSSRRRFKVDSIMRGRAECDLRRTSARFYLYPVVRLPANNGCVVVADVALHPAEAFRYYGIPVGGTGDVSQLNVIHIEANEKIAIEDKIIVGRTVIENEFPVAIDTHVVSYVQSAHFSIPSPVMKVGKEIQREVGQLRTALPVESNDDVLAGSSGRSVWITGVEDETQRRRCVRILG